MEVLQFALLADGCLGSSPALLELGGGLLLEMSGGLVLEMGGDLLLLEMGGSLLLEMGAGLLLRLGWGLLLGLRGSQSTGLGDSWLPGQGGTLLLEPRRGLLEQWGCLPLQLGGSLLLLELALGLGGSLLLELGGSLLLELGGSLLLEQGSNVSLDWGVELAGLLLFLSSGDSLVLRLHMITQNTSIWSCVATTCTLYWRNVTDNFRNLRLQSTQCFICYYKF